MQAPSLWCQMTVPVESSRNCGRLYRLRLTNQASREQSCIFLSSCRTDVILDSQEHRLHWVAAAVCRLKCVARISCSYQHGSWFVLQPLLHEFCNQRQVRNRALVSYDIIIQRRFFSSEIVWRPHASIQRVRLIWSTMCLSWRWSVALVEMNTVWVAKLVLDPVRVTYRCNQSHDVLLGTDAKHVSGPPQTPVSHLLQPPLRPNDCRRESLCSLECYLLSQWSSRQNVAPYLPEIHTTAIS